MCTNINTHITPQARAPPRAVGSVGAEAPRLGRLLSIIEWLSIESSIMYVCYDIAMNIIRLV